MLRMGQGSRLRVDDPGLLADIGVPKDSETLGISGHDAVFDTVVDHLDEMARAIVAAVEIAELSSAIQLLPPRRAGDISHSGRQRAEDWIEMRYHVGLASDHHAVAALQAPYAAAGADVDVMNSLGRELL